MAPLCVTWQIPPAQAFLIGVAAQLEATPSVRIGLATTTILLIGDISLFLQFKVGLYTILDTYLLDRFEESLLTGDDARYRLHHSQDSAYREASFQCPPDHPANSPGTRWYWLLSAPLRLLPLTMAWGGRATAADHDSRRIRTGAPADRRCSGDVGTTTLTHPHSHAAGRAAKEAGRCRAGRVGRAGTPPPNTAVA